MESFVPGSQIIKELEGTEDWTYSYIEPVAGENDKMKDTATRDALLVERELIVKDYEKATLQWIHAEGDLAEVKKRRNEIAGNLKVDYWKLDPYIRARSYYDRVGMIQPDGGLQFYPPTGDAAVELTPSTDATNGIRKVETDTNSVD